MEQSRRDFLASSVAAATGLTSAATLASLMIDPRVAEAAAQSTQDNSLLKFWSEQVRDPAGWAAHKEALEIGAKGPIVDYTPIFYVTGSSGPLGPMQQLSVKELASSADVLLHFKIITYKPSVADTQKKLQSGSLRVDVSQASPIPQFSQPFSWSTVSTLALTDSGNALPPIMKRIVDPKTFWDANSIVLPSGEGYLTHNLFVQEKPRHNFWSDLFGVFKTGVEVLGIVTNVGLPLVSQSALRWVDGLYGTVAMANDAYTHHIYQSSDMPIAATQAAMSAADPAAPPLAIKTGDYVAVPQWQSPQFEAEVLKDNYELQMGYLVPKGTTTTNEQELENLATQDKTLQQYTYMVISFTVQPYTMPTLPMDIGPLLGNGKSLSSNAKKSGA